MPLFRNSSFDVATTRARIAQSKAGSQEAEEEEAHLHHHHAAAHAHQEGHVQAHLGSHSGAGSFHHLHLTSALREIRGDSLPALTPVLSEDEEVVEEKEGGSNEESGLRMRIDKVPGGETKSGQLREETSDVESLTSTPCCVGEEERLESRADVSENNNGHQGDEEKSAVSNKHRGSI